MTTAVALFRGINVGGSNRLPMKELVAELESLGLEDIRTYIQSGNCVFNYPAWIPAALEGRISAAIRTSHGFGSEVLILTPAELQQAVRNNPFPTAEKEPKRLHLFFLTTRAKEPDMKAVERLRAPSERCRLGGRIFYLWAPDGIGRSKLAQNLDRCLGVNTTARNWRTVCRLLEMARERE